MENCEENACTDASLELHSRAERAHERLKVWSADIPFPLYCYANLDCSFHLVSNNDILQYVSPLFKNQKFYFSPWEYPVHPDKAWDDPSLVKLQKDLTIAARATGTEIFKNGGSTKMDRVMRCCCGIQHKQRTSNAAPGGVAIANKDYRKESLKYDRQNSRGPQGRSMPRRTVINRPAQATCRMFFVLGKDDIGFFLVAGRGRAEHSGHIKIDPEQKALRTHLLKEEDVQLLKSVGKANALNATGRNILYANTGQYLSSAQVRYRAQMGKVLALLPQNNLPDDAICEEH
jgi:hypothetical protein